MASAQLTAGATRLLPGSDSRVNEDSQSPKSLLQLHCTHTNNTYTTIHRKDVNVEQQATRALDGELGRPMDVFNRVELMEASE